MIRNRDALDSGEEDTGRNLLIFPATVKDWKTRELVFRDVARRIDSAVGQGTRWTTTPTESSR